MAQQRHWAWILSFCIHGGLLFALTRPLWRTELTNTKPPLQVSLWPPSQSMPHQKSATVERLGTTPSHQITTGKSMQTTPSKSAIHGDNQLSKPRPDVSNAKATEPTTVQAKSSATRGLQSVPQPTPSLPTAEWRDQISASLQRQQLRELSREELRAITEKNLDTGHAAKPSRQLTSREGELADDVIAELDDGSHIVRHGDRCFVAKPGADLLKDIMSIKGIQCGPSKDAVQQIEQIIQQRQTHGFTTR